MAKASVGFGYLFRNHNQTEKWVEHKIEQPRTQEQARFSFLTLIFFLLWFEGLLKTVHFVAYIIANLDDNLLLSLEFFPTSVLQNCLALFIGALFFSTPFLMFVDQREKD